MDKKMYHIEGEKLHEGGKIPVKTLGDSGEVFYELALEMVRTITENNRRNKPTVLICPVGPVGHYPIFVRLVNEGGISLKNCYFFNMDEYLNDDGSYIDKSDPLSFRGFMDREVYGRINPDLLMPEENRFFPNPEDPEALDRKMEELGGADLCIGGIGINGHVAFNEPEEDLSAEEFVQLPTRVIAISRETLVANAIGDLSGAIDAMPKKAVTMGMKSIYAARTIRLGVFRDWHRSVLRRAIYEEPTSAYPVTLLQNHKDCQIIANSNASQKAF